MDSEGIVRLGETGARSLMTPPPRVNRPKRRCTDHNISKHLFASLTVSSPSLVHFTCEYLRYLGACIDSYCDQCIVLGKTYVMEAQSKLSADLRR